MKTYQYKIVRTTLSEGAPELEGHTIEINNRGDQGWRAIFNSYDVERRVFLTLLEKESSRIDYDALS